MHFSSVELFHHVEMESTTGFFDPVGTFNLLLRRATLPNPLSTPRRPSSKHKTADTTATSPTPAHAGTRLPPRSEHLQDREVFRCALKRHSESPHQCRQTPIHFPSPSWRSITEKTQSPPRARTLWVRIPFATWRNSTQNEHTD